MMPKYTTLIWILFVTIGFVEQASLAQSPAELPLGVFKGKVHYKDIPSQPCKIEIVKESNGKTVVYGFTYDGAVNLIKWDLPLTEIRAARPKDVEFYDFLATPAPTRDGKSTQFSVSIKLNSDGTPKSALLTHRGFSNKCTF